MRFPFFEDFFSCEIGGVLLYLKMVLCYRVRVVETAFCRNAGLRLCRIDPYGPITVYSGSLVYQAVVFCYVWRSELSKCLCVYLSC